jgi:ribosomal subunit interface protein
VGTKTRSAGRVPPRWIGPKGVSQVDIIFKGRRTGLQDRFRRHATAKLAKIEKLDQKAIRIDVEVSQERNPRQSDRRERVELTIRSRGPVIRAEAAADDRFVALDRAMAKLEARLRRVCGRRKDRHSGQALPDVGELPGQLDGRISEGFPVADTDHARQAGGTRAANRALDGGGRSSGSEDRAEDGVPPAGAASGGAWGDGRGQQRSGDFVPIAMEGDGPLVVREKFHAAAPMTIDQALLEMELVGHDFYLFRDQECDLPSVVYRRCGYDYGVIRLVEEPARELAAARAAGGGGRRGRGVGQNRAAG